MLNCCCNPECCCTYCVSVVLLLVCALLLLVEPFIFYKWGGRKTFLTLCVASFALVAILYCHTCVSLERLMLIATLFVTAMGIVIAAHTLDGTKKATEAQVVNQYNERYFQENICKSLKVLWSYHDNEENLPMFSGQRTDINNFGKRIKPNDVSKLKEELNEENSDLDKARRTIKGYFLNAHAMLEQKFISKEAFRQIVDKEAISAFFIIIEVMEYAKREKGDYDYKPFWQIMNDFPDLYAKYKDSKF